MRISSTKRGPRHQDVLTMSGEMNGVGWIAMGDRFSLHADTHDRTWTVELSTEEARRLYRYLAKHLVPAT